MPKPKQEMIGKEIRCCVRPLEVRQEEKQRPRLVGYAAMFNLPSVDLGGFVEIVRPGAFTRTLAEGADVRALIDHDSSLIIGRNKAKTLSLAEDDTGLRVEIIPPDTQAGRDVVENVRLGNLDGMSFAFETRVQRWSDLATPVLRELLDVDLWDVSVVAYPAYPQTDVALRSLEAWRQAQPRGRDPAILRRRLDLQEKFLTGPHPLP